MLAKCAVVFVFLLSSTGLLVPTLLARSDSDAATQSEPVTQAIWLVVYMILLLLFLMRWQRFSDVATRDKLLLLLTATAVLSVLWSAAPEITARRGVALVGTTLFGIYLATRYSLRELLRLLAWALGIVALLSLLFALILPSYGISADPLTQGDWRGVFPHKNALGRTMALSAIVFLLLAMSNRNYRWISWSGFGLSSVLIFFSNSATALVVVVGVLLLLPIYRILRRPPTLAISLFICVLLLAGAITLWLLNNAETLLTALSKDATLTGRTELWSAVVDAIGERPWLGYGYSAFWLGWEGESASIWLRTGQEYYDSHSGILDLGLGLGLVGISIFTVQFFLAFIRAAVWAITTETMEGLWPVVFLTFMLLSNLTEGVILQQNNLYWILYVATVLSIATRGRRAYEAKRRGASPKRQNLAKADL